MTIMMNIMKMTLLIQIAPKKEEEENEDSDNEKENMAGMIL